VGLDRPGAQHELIGHLAVRPASRHELGDLTFTGGERTERPGRWVALSRPDNPMP
jgi:hypothetical protein